MMYEFEMIGDVVGKARPRMNTELIHQLIQRTMNTF